MGSLRSALNFNQRCGNPRNKPLYHVRLHCHSKPSSTPVPPRILCHLQAPCQSALCRTGLCHCMDCMGGPHSKHGWKGKATPVFRCGCTDGISNTDPFMHHLLKRKQKGSSVRSSHGRAINTKLCSCQSSCTVTRQHQSSACASSLTSS